MTSQTIPPPEKLSDLILLAVADARLLDRSIYWPDYSEWHHSVAHPYESATYCHVCLAGAVIAQTLGCNRWLKTHPSGYPRRWETSLNALEEIREGRYKVAYALHHWDKTKQQIDAVFTPSRYPQPVNRPFTGWEELDAHLTSLEEVARLMAADGH